MISESSVYILGQWSVKWDVCPILEVGQVGNVAAHGHILAHRHKTPEHHIFAIQKKGIPLSFSELANAHCLC